MKNKLKNLFIILLMLILTTNIFGAIPHSYVTENPSKEVTQIETIKRKDKAELNLTITKKNSKEAKVEKAFYNMTTGLFYMIINGKEYNIAPDDNLIISDKLEELPNLSTTNGRRKINKMFNTREINYNMESNGNWRNIKTTFEELPKELYISILDRNYNLKDVLNLKDIKVTKVADKYMEAEVYATILEGYNGKIYPGQINSPDYGGGINYSFNDYIIYNRSKIVKWDSSSTRIISFLLGEDDILKEFSIGNKIEKPDSKTFPSKVYNINNDLTIETINEYNLQRKWSNLYLKFIKFPKKDFYFPLKIVTRIYDSWNETERVTYYFTYKRASTDGESNLNIDSSYNNEYIKYDSCTVENIRPVALLNPVQGVSINQVWGDGLLEFESGDDLKINGQQHKILYNGLSEKRTTLNGIDLSYKVENGKLQLRINGYEPEISSSQPLDIEIERILITEQGGTITRKVLKHTINITVPNIQTLSGNSTLNFGENYPANTYINFNANSNLADTNPLQLENFVQGVTFNTTGNGILQVKYGDKLSVNGNEMIVGHNNNIEAQKLRIGNLDYTYKVENGKFSLALNDWGVLEPNRDIEIKVIRNNKPVSTHKFTIKAPRKVIGSSNLGIGEQYVPGTTIRFQGISLTAPSTSSLERPIPMGVTLSSQEGHGIPFMQEGDILEINDGISKVLKAFNISANGTLGLQTVRMGTSEFNISVQSGKLRLALNKWFSDNPINLNLTLKRGTNKIMEHNIIINVPRVPKVEGTSNLVITNSYKNEYIKFNSCTLDNLQPISLIGNFQGVSLNSLSGNGLLTLENGDTLDINGQQYMLNSNSLPEKILNLNGINLSYKVENGKLQLRINNYDIGITQAQPLTLKVTRNGKEIMSHTMNIKVPNIQKLVGESNLTIAKEYTNEYIPFTSCTLENQQEISLERLITGVTLQQRTGKGLLTLENGDTLTINGQQHMLNSNSLPEKILNLNGINLSYKVENGKLQLRINSYDLGITQAQPLTLKVTRNGKEVMSHTMNIKVPNIQRLEGKSILIVKEYYPVNQFINFNSTTMEEGSPLALENSLRDVSLTTSGKGIVTMQDGDKLEIDGKQVIVGAGGNLAEQKATIGNLEYTYKVENGKLRLALNKWGVLEPDRNLMIRVWRTKDGAESKLVEHTLTVKSPRRVEGSSDLTYDNDYQIRTFVRFGGISLTAPGISSLETPVPAGVVLSSQAGQGVPFMEEGDILEVNDGVTRAVHQFTIGAGGTLGKKQIKFNNSDVTFYVENGKLRAGLNNWIVNKPVKLNLRLIRGTNEIMNHAIGFKVPEAPFNIKENGLLDFGRVTAGSKRTAETNIILEMLNDVDSVKFNLKDTQPVMENANGKQLQVNEIQTIVKKQGERTYLVKLHGKLIIPEDTQMGEYSGSTILELRIK